MKTILRSRLAWLAALAAGIAVRLAAFAADVPTVSTVSSLETIVDGAWTNDTMAKVMPPGDFQWNSSLGVIAYETGFDTNFLAALVPETNATFTLYPVEVIETNTTPRLRYYLNLTNGLAHTTTVSIANYPEDWIEDVYGDPPGWLSGSALTQWYTERDPRRQHIRVDLISTSDVPAYIAMLTNSVGSWSSGGTNINLCEFYSNDIAFVAIHAGSAGIDVYLHAPTNVPTVDLFQSTNLLETYGWTLPATLDRVTDPILWTHYGSDPISFFDSGNAGVDTDGDGLADIREIRLYGTSAYLADSDGDGLSDGLEVMTYGLNPLNADSDGDGIPDDEEVASGTNPNSADSDGDGLTDYEEIYAYFGHVDPLDADTDDDGLSDYAELVTYGTYPRSDDTDQDNLTDYEEVITYSTNPLLVDSDGDGMYDYYEVYYGFDPNNAADAAEDEDSDGFNNLTEYKWMQNPTSSNSTPPQSQLLIVRPPGTNVYRSADFKLLAIGDLGDQSALVRVRPFWDDGALAGQLLHHSQTPGMYINGTEASSLSTPISVAASGTATEYKITADPSAVGTNLHVWLTTTNDPGDLVDQVWCYPPYVTSVNFWGPGAANYVDVYHGQTNALWISMPADTNACRVRMRPYQNPTAGYGIPNFYQTDHVLAKVTGTGADPSAAALNTFDWQSAYGVWYDDPHWTRGIRLDYGAYTFEVGYDWNANGALEAAEVQETCRVHVPSVDINGDYNRDGNPVDDPNETNEVAFAGTNGFVILVNADDDDGDGEPDCAKSGDPLNYYINGSNDLDDVYILRFPRLGLSTNEMPDDLKISISVLKPGTETTTENAVVYPVRQAGQQGYKSFQLSAASTRALFGGTGTVDMGIEGRAFGEQVVVRVQLRKGTMLLGTDEVRVLLAPFFVLSNCDETTKVYSGADSGPAEWPILYAELTNALNGVVDVEVIGSATFIQDDGEIGYTRLPPGMSTEKPTTVMDRGDPAFENMVSTNTCYFYFGGGHGGSLEAAPATAAQPYGSIIVGSTNLVATEAFLLKQAVQSVSNSLITLPTEWLAVGHADEVFTIVPTASGFSVLVADLDLAIELLEDNPDEETWGGFMSRSNILAYYEANTAKVALVEARLAAVRASLSEGLGISESQFIKVPVAFSVHDWNLSLPRAEAVLPNSVNMLVVKNTSGTRRLVLPYPFFDPFLEDLVPKLTAIGYDAGTEIRAICTTEPHAQAGEVHCATISRRVAP